MTGVDVGSDHCRVVPPEDSEAGFARFEYFRHLFAYVQAGRRMPAGARVLEVGSGEGYGADYLASLGFQVTATDLSHQALAHARARYSRFGLCESLGTDLPFRSGVFDAVVSFQVIEHVADPAGYLRELSRVAKPGGSLFLTTPNRRLRLRPWQKPWNPYHVHEYAGRELRRFLRRRVSRLVILGVTAPPVFMGLERARVKPTLRKTGDRLLGRLISRISPAAARSGRIGAADRRRRLRLESRWRRTKAELDGYFLSSHLGRCLDFFVVAAPGAPSGLPPAGPKPAPLRIGEGNGRDIKKSLLVTLDFPPDLGGVSAFYDNVCRELPANKIAVLAPEPSRNAGFDRGLPYPVIRKSALNRFHRRSARAGVLGKLKIAFGAKWIATIRRFNRVAKDEGIELIQAGQILPIGTLAWWYKKRRGIPYIFYAHGLDILLPQNRAGLKRLLGVIIKGAKAIIANSGFTKDELVKLGADPDKVRVVYPCPNLEAAAPSEAKLRRLRSELGLEGKSVLLSVGRLVKRKGHDMVIRSLPAAIRSVPELVYLIVGDGPYRPELERLAAANGLGDCIRFVGAVGQEDLPSYFQIADAFIMPSRRLANGDVEGFGIVYLEANLFGKPVIGGRSGGVPEAIVHGKTGLLVDPEDLGEIAQAIVRLMTDKGLAEEMGRQGRRRTMEEFNWRVQTEKILEVLS